MGAFPGWLAGCVLLLVVTLCILFVSARQTAEPFAFLGLLRFGAPLGFAPLALLLLGRLLLCCWGLLLGLLLRLTSFLLAPCRSSDERQRTRSSKRRKQGARQTGRPCPCCRAVSPVSRRTPIFFAPSCIHCSTAKAVASRRVASHPLSLALRCCSGPNSKVRPYVVFPVNMMVRSKVQARS